MFDHIGLTVASLAVSQRFYQKALASLGFELGSHDASYAGFGPPGAPGLWLYQGKGGTAIHVAFKAPNRDAVEAFYRDGLAAGGRDNGGPGLRTDYAPDYFAAFLLDPDGNNVEAVCYG